jgi:hypothetical protein
MIEAVKSLVRRIRSEMRVAQKGMRASRRYGRALKLEKQRRYQEAYAVVGEALELLPDSFGPETLAPAVGSQILVMTVLYADLAEKLGTPDAAHGAIRRALRLATPFEGDPSTRKYIDW